MGKFIDWIGGKLTGNTSTGSIAERRDRRRAARRPPPALTVRDQLGNMPGANWSGGYDPNTGIAPQVSGAPNLFGPGSRNDGRGFAGVRGRPAQAGRSQYVPNAARVTGDATGRAAALEALQGLRDRSQTGWTQLDRAALDQAQRQAGQYERGQREAIMQNAAARGMTGSGLGMMAALDAQQSGADRAYDAATNIGIQGRDRALAAQQAAGQLGLGIDTQQFAQGMARGAAADMFNQWATGMQQGAEQFSSQQDFERWKAQQEANSKRWDQILGFVTAGTRSIMGGFGGGGGGSTGGGP